jgi:NAD(P)H dehydrogenase (quinone)
MQKILVTGATGHLGRGIIKNLLTHLSAENIVGIARQPELAADIAALGVEVRRADYTDYDLLVQALQGIDKLYLVSAVAFTDRIAQHGNVIRAARAAGVKHIVYPSIQRDDAVSVVIDSVTESDLATEGLLRESGMAYTIIYHPMYAESIPIFIGGQVAVKGIRVPAGNGRTPFTSRDDLAAAGAAILAKGGYENTEVSLNAGVSYSMDDLAKIYAEVLGTPVAYSNISAQTYMDECAAAGFPAPAAAFLSQWFVAMAAGAFDAPSPVLAQLTGTPPKSLREVLANALAQAA